jgi:hypothetical protein
MHLQTNVIGLFKPWYSQTYDMVVSNDNGYLKTISIGHLFGLQTNHIDASNGKLVMFEDNENLYRLLSSPKKLEEYVNKIKS